VLHAPEAFLLRGKDEQKVIQIDQEADTLTPPMARDDLSQSRKEEWGQGQPKGQDIPPVGGASPPKAQIWAKRLRHLKMVVSGAQI
jgi:hypothetical protein